METVIRGGVGRTLLGLTENLPMSHDMSLHSSALIVTAVAMIIVIIAVVAMCVCNQNSSPQLTTISPRKPTMDNIVHQASLPQVSNNHVTVDIPVDSPDAQRSPNSPDSISDVNKRESGQGAARTSATLSRQLPDPPVNKETGQASLSSESHKAGSNDQRLSNTSQSSQPDDPLDDYDRLHQPKNLNIDDPSYDHVDQNILTNQRASSMPNRENIYATPSGEQSDSGSGTVTSVRTTSQAIRENIYAVPNGEPSFESGSGIVGAPENDYTDPSGEDPYAKIDSGNKASSRLSTNVAEKEAVNDVYDQPDGEFDPYASIDSGNKVAPRLSFVAPETADIDSSAAASANASPPAVAPSSNGTERTTPVLEDDEMYAVVNRPRGTSPHPMGSPPAPALPDRGYGPEEVGILPGSGHLFQVADLSTDSGIDNSTDNTEHPPEPSYTEVTARESLASMQQRQQTHGVSVGGGAAGPGYDQYPDLPENYYSKVDGSSGDGAFSAQGAVALDNNNRQYRNSEMYSEINTSGGSYMTISTVPVPIEDSMIPAPPPVASLPQLRQIHQSDQRRQADSGPEHNEEGYAIVSPSNKQSHVKKEREAIPNSRSVDENLGQPQVRRVTGPVNRLAQNRRSAPLATVESDHDLSIDFGYQSVKDVPDLESESDFDPNYETVADTKRKASKKHKIVPMLNGAASSHVPTTRRHEYEEVTEFNNGQQESAYAIKKRVLQNHCYEDITEVKKEQKQQKKREL